jgi:hypothetical protein
MLSLCATRLSIRLDALGVRGTDLGMDQFNQLKAEILPLREKVVQNYESELASELKELEFDLLDELQDTLSENYEEEAETRGSRGTFSADKQKERKALKAFAKENAIEVQTLLASSHYGEFNDAISVKLKEFEEAVKELERDQKDAISEARFEYDVQFEMLLESIGLDTKWAAYIKKPSKKKLEAAVIALNQQHPDWELLEDGKAEKALVSTLISNFPELAKKNAPLHELGEQGKGCLVILALFSIAMITAGVLVIAPML